MDDGSEQAVFSPVTMTNADTPWELDANGKRYRKQIGSLRAAFSCNETSDEMFSLEKDAHKVTFSAAMKPGQRRAGIVPTLRQADGMDNAFLFENVADNTDMEYSMVPGGIKENILVKQRTDCYRYPFAIGCENVSISADSTAKQIKFISNDSGEEVFFIPAPFMVDAYGNTSAAVHYEMEAQEYGSVMLTVVADSDWLNDPNRAFPVTIDPQVKVSHSNDIDTYSWKDGTMTASSEHIIGRKTETDPDTNMVSYSTNRMYLHFDLPILPNNPRIKKAELTFCQNAVSNEIDVIPKLGLFQITEDIVVGPNTPAQSTRLIDFEPMKAASEDGSVVNYTFDITKFFDEAANGAASYQNLVLQMMDESINANSFVTIVGNDAAENRPSVIVTYESSYGVNSSYPSHSHSIGPCVQGSVDLGTGNLMFEAEDFAWAGNRMPITLRHLYTSALASRTFTHNGVDLITADFSGMKIGNGWKLNLMQSMRGYIYMHEGDNIFGYAYTDENGDTVYFKTNPENTNLLEAVDNSDMVYDRTTRILTKGDEKYQFDDAFRLISISDEINTMTLDYVDGRLTTVTDGARIRIDDKQYGGRSFTFNYDTEDHLTSITAPDGTQVIYGYDGDLLTSITYPNGSKTAITYTGNKPASVAVLDAESNVLYQVCYTFNGDRVSSVAEFGENNIEGKCSTYSYSAAARRTVVQSTQQADEGEEDEVITTSYTFDEDGQILSQYAYAQEANKVGITGTAGGIHPYFGEESGSTFGVSRNLLLDHSFEYIGSNATEDGVFGNRALKRTSDNPENVGSGPSQTVTLQPGDYTLSAYIRFASNDQTTENSGACLQVETASGKLLGRSELLTFSEKEYIRMAVPFHLDEATSVKNRMLLVGAGTAYFDGVQLEANAYVSPYNLLRNGSFERGNDGCWILSSTEDAVFTNAESFDGTVAVKCSGGLDKAVNVKQEVLVRSARSDRETFTLSGWAKAAAVPQRDRDMDAEPHFRLRAEIHYNDADFEDTSIETFTADFSACTENWQYTSVEFSKSKYRTVEKVYVYCDYDNNHGDAFFDDIQLIRNSLETELEEEDFATESNVVADDNDTTASEDGIVEYTVPEFEERKDQFGNAITETTFTDGEFGTIYRAFDYGDSTGNDLLRETDARGNMTHYEVNADTSRNETVTDRCGNQTAYEYDASGKTTKVTAKAADGTDIATVSYNYDAYGELTAITRGDRMSYDLSYDSFHNLESIGVRGKAENLVHYTYKNGNGRLKEITYANGDTMKATYNAQGQMIAEKWFDATGTLTAHYRYAYDNEGNIVRSVDILSQKEYNYLYEDGRICRAAECDITLDENNMVLTRTVLFTLRYIYDQEGTLIRKHVIPADNTCHEIFFCEEDGNDNATLTVKLDEKTYTSHSKTDSFGRKEFDEVQTGFASISRQFLYHAGQATDEHMENGMVKSAPTTNLVKQILLSDGRAISYEYDPEERITKVIDSVDGTTEYTYDAQGQLLTETVNGVPVNSMTYDAYGNILTKNGKTYTYDDTAWKDKLTSYDGQSISYDAQGNPLTYLGSTLTWEKGRQLKSLTNSDVSCTYTYNANGIRTSKTVNGVKHTYTLDGSKILRETWPSVDEDGNEYANCLLPLYDNDESICGILYNDIPYYFLKNLQGDIIAICNQSGEVKARYTYDAWGVCTISEDTSGCNIATINPFRYRGYYYDAEIGMYYLQSRYYDPVAGRFINGDSCFVWDIERRALSTNCYHYCENDPVNQLDTTGKAVLQIVLRAIIGAIFGAAMQYLSDVLQNLIECIIDNKKVTKSVWKRRGSMWDYTASIVTGACDATLRIGVWLSIGISCAVTILNHLLNWASGRGFNFKQLIKDLAWNALLSIVSNAIGKKFKPKQGKALNKAIRARYKVKGTNAYKRLWKSLCDSVDWNVYVVSTFVNALRSASRRILDFVEEVLRDCVIKALDKKY